MSIFYLIHPPGETFCWVSYLATGPLHVKKYIYFLFFFNFFNFSVSSLTSFISHTDFLISLICLPVFTFNSFRSLCPLWVHIRLLLTRLSAVLSRICLSCPTKPLWRPQLFSPTSQSHGEKWLKTQSPGPACWARTKVTPAYQSPHPEAVCPASGLSRWEPKGRKRTGFVKLWSGSKTAFLPYSSLPTCEIESADYPSTTNKRIDQGALR